MYSRILLPLAHYGLLLSFRKNLAKYLFVYIDFEKVKFMVIPSNIYIPSKYCVISDLETIILAQFLCISLVYHHTKFRISGCQYFYFP